MALMAVGGPNVLICRWLLAWEKVAIGRDSKTSEYWPRLNRHGLNASGFDCDPKSPDAAEDPYVPGE